MISTTPKNDIKNGMNVTYKKCVEDQERIWDRWRRLKRHLFYSVKPHLSRRLDPSKGLSFPCRATFFYICHSHSMVFDWQM